MEVGTLKKGDSVKFTEEAINILGNAVDNKTHVVLIVGEIFSDYQMITFEDGDRCDIQWLEKIKL